MKLKAHTPGHRDTKLLGDLEDPASDRWTEQSGEIRTENTRPAAMPHTHKGL